MRRPRAKLPGCDGCAGVFVDNNAFVLLTSGSVLVFSYIYSAISPIEQCYWLTFPPSLGTCCQAGIVVRETAEGRGYLLKGIVTTTGISTFLSSLHREAHRHVRITMRENDESDTCSDVIKSGAKGPEMKPG